MYKIDVAINLSRIKADAYGNLWVSSRGNYDDVPSNLYRLEPNGGRYQVAEAMNIPASNMAIHGDSLYIYSVEYSNQTSKNTVTYAIIDVKKKRVVSRKFITDGTELDIVIPYGIAIHPETATSMSPTPRTTFRAAYCTVIRAKASTNGVSARAISPHTWFFSNANRLGNEKRYSPSCCRPSRSAAVKTTASPM